MHRPIKTSVGIIIIILFAIAAGLCIYFLEGVGQGIIRFKDNTFPSSPCSRDKKQCPDGSYVSRKLPECEFAPCSKANNKPENLVGNDRDEHGCIGSAGYSWCEEKQKCLKSWEEKCDEGNFKNPEIEAFHQANNNDKSGEQIYSVGISNFNAPVWLCIQEDLYSKPSELTCNSGTLLESSSEIVYFTMRNEALLILAADSTMSQIFDEVHVKRLNNADFQMSPVSKLCGTVKHNTDGSYFIDSMRLLTSPGWKDLLPYINKSVCIKGVEYQQSFRVYFIN